MNKAKQARRMEYLFVFMMGFLPRVIMAMFSSGLIYISDETSAIYVAAKLAGYDWSSVVSRAGYYGIGYLWVYAPLFKMGVRPEIIYRTIVVGGGVLIGLTGVVADKIVSSYFKDVNRINRIIISFLVASASCLYSYRISCRNEEIIGFLSLMIAYELIAIIREPKRNNQILLVILLIYAQWCHERAIILILSLVVTAVLFRVATKKSMLSRYVWYLLAIGYFATKFWVKLYQLSIWGNTGSLRNASSVSFLMQGLDNFTWGWLRIKSCLMIFCGVLFTGSVMTSCLLIVAILSIVGIAFFSLRKKLCYDNSTLIFPGIYFLVATFATIFGLSLTWGQNVYNGMQKGDYQWVYSYKAFTYMRYPGPFVVPLLLIGILVIYRYKEWTSKIALINLIVILLLGLFWNVEMIPYVESRNIDVFTLYKELFLGVEGKNFYLLLVKILVFYAIIWIIMAKDTSFNRLCFLMVITGICMIGTEASIFIKMDYSTNKSHYEQCDGGVELIRNMPENTFDNIYVWDAYDRTDHQIWYSYQFYLYDKKINPGLPSDISEECVIFTNQKSNYILLKDYYVIQIDENEYLYTNCKYIMDEVGDYIRGKKN